MIKLAISNSYFGYALVLFTLFFSALAKANNLSSLSTEELQQQFIHLKNADKVQAMKVAHILKPRIIEQREQLLTLLLDMAGLELSQNRIKQTLSYANEALEIAEQIQNKPRQATALNFLGNSYYFQGDFEQAILMHEKALAMRQSLMLIKEVGDSHNNLALCFTQLGRKDKTLEHYQQAFEIYSELGLHHDRGDVMANIAGLYSQLKQYDLALQYYFDALAIFEKFSLAVNIAAVKGNVGVVYNAIGESEKAIPLYLQALAINKAHNLNYNAAANLNNLASAYNSIQEFDIAIDYAKQAINLCMSHGFETTLSNSLHTLAQSYQGLSKLEIALEHATNALRYAEKTQDQFQLIDALRLLAQLNGDLSRYQAAYEFQKRLKFESDKLAKQRTSRNIELSALRIDLLNSNNKIAFLDRNNQLELVSFQREISQYKMLLVVIVALFLIALVVVFRRSSKQLARVKREVDNQLEFTNKTKYEFLEQLSMRLMTPLSNIVSIIEESKKHEPMQREKTCNQVIQEANGALLLVTDLHDYILLRDDNMQISRSTFDIANVVASNVDYAIQLIGDGSVQVISKVDMNRYRVCSDQALLDKVLRHIISNAVKHTDIGTIEITIAPVEHFVKVSVRDTGEGIKSGLLNDIFSVNLAKSDLRSHGISLAVSKMLIELQGGRMTASSTVGQGTIMSFTVPVATKT